MGRWLNPDSIKIYARMTKQEYATWVDKLMSVRHIDTARTTNLPIMDAAAAIAAWGSELDMQAEISKAHVDEWDKPLHHSQNQDQACSKQATESPSTGRS